MGILSNPSYTLIKPITKGWSGDKKYYIETLDGKRLLLRVGEISQYERKKAEYGMMARAYAHGVLTPEPLGFGICDNGESIYCLSSWLDGKAADEVLPCIPEAQQYELGVKAGEEMKKMHQLSAPADAEKWDARFGNKVQGRLDFYGSNPIKCDGGDIIARYLRENRHWLNGRPMTFVHNDYNTGNLIITPEGNVGVIDFNSFNLDHGDPWWEFDALDWGAEPPAYFYTGMINAYFANSVPDDFFRMLSYYLAYDAFAALCDTFTGEQGEAEDGVRHLNNVLRWHNNMQEHVPEWYMGNVEIMDIYDATRKRTGRKYIRGSKRSADDYVLIASALLRRSDGRYLITKRSSNKTDAYMWNIQGGAALAGEDSLATAIRESGEECGIVPCAENAQLFASEVKGGTIYDIWLFEQDFSMDDVILSEDETCDAMAVTLDEIVALNECGEFTNGIVIPADEMIALLQEWEAKG